MKYQYRFANQGACWLYHKNMPLVILLVPIYFETAAKTCPKPQLQVFKVKHAAEFSYYKSNNQRYDALDNSTNDRLYCANML